MDKDTSLGEGSTHRLTGLRTLELRSWSGLISLALFLPLIRPHIDTGRWSGGSHCYTCLLLYPPEYWASSEVRDLLCESQGSHYEGFGLNLLEWWWNAAGSQHATDVFQEYSAAHTDTFSSLPDDWCCISNGEIKPNTWCVVKAIELKSWREGGFFFWSPLYDYEIRDKGAMLLFPKIRRSHSVHFTQAWRFRLLVFKEFYGWIMGANSLLIQGFL